MKCAASGRFARPICHDRAVISHPAADGEHGLSAGSPPVDVRPDEVRSDEAEPAAAVPDEPVSDEPVSDDVGPGDPSRPPRGRTRRRVLLAAAAVVVVLVLATAWLAFRVYQAARALQSAQDDLGTVLDVAHSGDLSSVQAALPAVHLDLQTARRAVDDPVWRAAIAVPWAGRQLGAVRTVTVALDDIVTAAGPALDALDTALSAQDAPHTDGRLVLAPLVDALPPIIAAADQVDAASSSIAAIDSAGLTPRLAAPVADLQQRVAAVSGTVESGVHLARLLPGLLGADGPRTYLLVSLNSAELRTQGGIVGAVALLHADDGTIDLVEQRTTTAFVPRDTSILPLTPQEELFQTDRLGRWIQDATMTPDFPRAAQLIAAQWAAAGGEQVDGVIATDPVAAADLLRATGPVTEPSGITLDAGTLISQLLHETYLRLPDATQGDQFYMDVAAAIFHAVGNGQGDRLGVVDALVSAAQAGRVRVWSAHDDEQRELTASTVGAAFLSGAYPDDAGVFLDDGTAGKLDYYLTTTVTVENMVCTGPDPSATVRLDLAYDPPADVADQPRYVTGYPVSALPTGWLATNVTVYTPVGASLGALGLDDGYVSGTSGTEDGRAVQVVTSWLAPGEHVTYRATVPVRNGSLTVWSTPSLTSDGFRTVGCAAG